MDELDEMDLDEMDFDDDEAEEFDAKKRRRSRGGGARLFNLFRKRVFDYTYLAAGTNTSITIRRALKLSPFYYYWFGLRIHNRIIQLGGSSFSLDFYNTLPFAGDPQEFTEAAPIVSLTCTNASPADDPPKLKLTTANNRGPYFKVVLKATQGTGGTLPLQLYAELSAVILARPA